MATINLEVREFSQTIINFMNQSPLPIEIKRLCMNDIAMQLSHAADEQIKAEILERDKQTGNVSPRQEEKNEFVEDPSKNPMEKQNRTGTEREEPGAV